jgi:hypothetical protein
MSPSSFTAEYNSTHKQYGQMVPRGVASVVPWTSNSWVFDWDESDSTFQNQATSAYNHARPGNPGVNMGQFIGEIGRIPTLPFSGAREGARRARERGKTSAQYYKDKTRWYKDLGGEYLNASFGWLPFLSDLNGFLKATADMDRRLEQLARDNGKPVRRRISLPIQSFPKAGSYTQSTQHLFGYPPLHAFFYRNGGIGSSRTTNTYHEKAQFTAKFRYWIPDFEQSATRNRIRLKLYGLDITPSLVWELTPWSWLIDWHTNVGDVISNMSGNAAENLVAEYAYFARTRDYVRSIDEVVPLVGGDVHCSATFTLRKYVRYAASPFGFGISPADYSSKQVGILGALGLSRA